MTLPDPDDLIDAIMPWFILLAMGFVVMVMVLLPLALLTGMFSDCK